MMNIYSIGLNKRPRRGLTFITKWDSRKRATPTGSNILYLPIFYKPIIPLGLTQTNNSRKHNNCQAVK